ncbi:MAG: FGGY-family carbohydrate kinase [Chloroflexi bacterium]|nr:FGGY-family carbohydrate kinase [Chloroflexota bacterium]
MSHVHRDPPTPLADIAAGIYASIISRIMTLCKRIGIEKEVAVTGGVALSKGMVNILEQSLGFKVIVPEMPQNIAALGAALIAAENMGKGILQ